MCRAASIPSMPGMRMSSRTTSGSRPHAHFERLAAVGGLAGDRDVVEFVEQAAQSLARRRLVVDDQHAYRFRAGWVCLHGQGGIFRRRGPPCHFQSAGSAVPSTSGKRSLTR